MTRKKPWNRIDVPVYSVSSYNETKNNMNICTYVTAISMHPKKFIVGIYKNTCTLYNVQLYPKFVLQLLSEKQFNLIKLLGKTTGLNSDKISRIKTKLIKWKEFDILKDAIAIIEMEAIEWMDAGDHWAVLCSVTSYKNLNDLEPLMLSTLRSKKIIRA